MVEKVSIEDKIGHLFVVNIYFDLDKSSEREFLSTQIYSPILGKDNL